MTQPIENKELSANEVRAFRQAAEWLDDAPIAIAFTGAGISTESGIPDFRSPGGVWARYQPVYFDEFLASVDARNEYWRQKAEAHDDFVKAKPNDGHKVMAAWQQRGKLAAVITQNIDELHQQAGCANVLELHGTARRIACLDCAARFDADGMVRQFRAFNQAPPCPECGGRLKHATISFGQALPEDVLQAAVELAEQCGLMFAVGSSLVVEPAASLPRIAKSHGARVVIINRDATPLDDLADIVIRAPIGAVLRKIDEVTM